MRPLTTMRLPLLRLIVALVALVTLAGARALAQSDTPMRALLAEGDRAWAAASYDDALRAYAEVLRRDSTSTPATFRVATLLAWRHDFGRSIALYRKYLTLAPGNADGRIGLARVLAWRGDYAQALAICDSVLADHPHYQDAALLANQVISWSAARSPSVEPTIISTDDSDRNRTLTYLLSAGISPPWSGRVQADASYRTADLGAAHGTSATLRTSTSWTPRGAWTLRGDVGAVQLDGTGGGFGQTSHTVPIAMARLSGRVAERIALGAGVGRAAFDETAALIAAGIATTEGEGDLEVTLRPRLSLGGAGGWTRLTGETSSNRRVDGSAAVRWTAATSLSVAAGVRAFGYDHVATDGYFTPQRYLLAEASAHWHLGGDLGWALDSELGLGRQEITVFGDSSTARLAQRYAVTALYRPAPGVEWSIGGSFANLASPITISSADYRAYSLTIRGRVRL